MKSYKSFLNEERSANEMYGLDQDIAMEIINAAGQYTSDAHEAANQMWDSAKELISYLKSDHIPKKYHKEFDKGVARFANESVNEGTTPTFKRLIKRAKALGIETVSELEDLIYDEFEDANPHVSGADFEIAKKMLKLDESVNESFFGDKSMYLNDVEQLIIGFGDDFEPSEIVDNAKSIEKDLIKTVKSAVKQMVGYAKDNLGESVNESDVSVSKSSYGVSIDFNGESEMTFDEEEIDTLISVLSNFNKTGKVKNTSIQDTDRYDVNISKAGNGIGMEYPIPYSEDDETSQVIISKGKNVEKFINDLNAAK